MGLKKTSVLLAIVLATAACGVNKGLESNTDNAEVGSHIGGVFELAQPTLDGALIAEFKEKPRVLISLVQVNGNKKLQSYESQYKPGDKIIFDKLEVATYKIEVKYFDGSKLLLEGDGEAKVKNGETTTAKIKLRRAGTGSLVIEIDWQFVYSLPPQPELSALISLPKDWSQVNLRYSPGYIGIGTDENIKCYSGEYKLNRALKALVISACAKGDLKGQVETKTIKLSDEQFQKAVTHIEEVRFVQKLPPQDGKCWTIADGGSASIHVRSEIKPADYNALPNSNCKPEKVIKHADFQNLIRHADDFR